MQFPQKQEVKSYLMLSQTAVEFFLGGGGGSPYQTEIIKRALVTLLELNEMNWA